MSRFDFFAVLSAIYFAPYMTATFAASTGIVCLGLALYFAWKDK